MSGHSKWSSIKYQKATTDARRGQAFTKLANLIAAAVKSGGKDPETNFKLRLAITKAKSANMPSSNIDRAIARGAGSDANNQIEEIVYEGYGPSGAAFMIEVATDNRNRAASSIRSILSKHGGRLAETGTVGYQFSQKGVILVKTDDLEQATLDAIDAGAQDVKEESKTLIIYTTPVDLDKVRNKLAESGYIIDTAELEYIAQNPLAISDSRITAQLIKIINLLEELDDVTAVHANFEITTEII